MHAGDGLYIVASGLDAISAKEREKADLAVVLDGEIKGEASNTLRLGSGHNLERLDDTGEGLSSIARGVSSHLPPSSGPRRTRERISFLLTWCSRPEYSPSVFSRMMAKSTSR